MDEPRPKVAIGVLIFRDGKILFGKRKGDGRTDGMYGIPGGHMENGEGFVEAATREIAEEVGVAIANVSFVGIVNVREFLPVHYLMIILRADWAVGEAQILEPEKCDEWIWRSSDELPSPMTPGTAHGVQCFLEGKTMFD